MQDPCPLALPHVLTSAHVAIHGTVYTYRPQIPNCDMVTSFEACVAAAEKPDREGSSVQHLRFLVPSTIPLMVFGTRDLKFGLTGPSGRGFILIDASLDCLIFRGPSRAPLEKDCSR